jgi:hypothetical protein
MQPSSELIGQELIEERRAHTTREGYSVEHDDEHGNCELARAAAAYAAHAAIDGFPTHPWRTWISSVLEELWPWGRERWKPKSPRQDLVRAGALIIAEIERLDRRSAAENAQAEAR